jgi:hypothetical protein
MIIVQNTEVTEAQQQIAVYRFAGVFFSFSFGQVKRMKNLSLERQELMLWQREYRIKYF